MRRRQVFQLKQKVAEFMGGKVNQCPYCQKEFKDSRGRKMHLGTHE